MRSPLLQVRVEPSNKKKGPHPALDDGLMGFSFVARSATSSRDYPPADDAGNLNDDEQFVRAHPVFIRQRTAYAVKFIMFTIL